ncbi:MAG: hypothetical protein ACYTGG_03200 [Planctomycetota bacterium]|jgi:hypothetical protein
MTGRRPIPAASASCLAATLLVALTARSGAAPPTTTSAATQPAAPPATQPAAPPLPDEAPPAVALVRTIEWAHGASTWRTKQAIEARLAVRFGGSAMLAGKMTYDPHRNLVRIDLDSGQMLLFDGDAAWMSPADQPVPMARFHLLTWPYFLAAPFKLDDPGSHISRPRLRMLRDRPHESAKLTFDAGIGDSPDDWYIVYAEPGTNRLVSMAYIVTYGNTVEKAEEEPHAIVYGGWQTIEGVTLSTQWTFFNWSEEAGAHGDAIGSVTLSNLAFTRPAPDFFKKPEDAVEDAPPAQ